MCSVITSTMAFEPQKWMARRYAPNAACSFRYWRLWYAWSAAGTYTSARQMPVAIWSAKSVIVALPKTYHQLAADTPHPARDLRRRAVPRDAERVVIRRQARLTFGEAADSAERDPRLSSAAANRSEDVSDDRDASQHGGDGAQSCAQREQESAPRRRRRRQRVVVSTHRVRILPAGLGPASVS